jgi:putative transposase
MPTLTFKYRVYPCREIEKKLAETLETCRWLYNRLLEESKKAKEKGKPLRMYDCHNMIPLLKKENPSLNNVYSKVLQMVSQTMWGNIHGLSQLKKNGRRIGNIRFKGAGWYKTLNYNQSGFRIGVNTLSLSKIGDIRIKMHRPVQGKVKGVIVKREGEKWYAIVQTDTEVLALPDNDRIVGIDVGLKAFAVDTDGHEFENPRYLDRTLDRVKRVQRNLSRKKKDSNNREKAKAKLAKVHDKVKNQRNDFLHKLSRFYINMYGTICVEALDVKSLNENPASRGLHRNIHDAGWARFLAMLSYKAESAGRRLVTVEPRNTSQACSQCGSIVHKELKDRIHDCPYCGLVIDRDKNAAYNILIAGMGHPVGPVESKPLLHLTVEQALAMNQEATAFSGGSSHWSKPLY